MGGFPNSGGAVTVTGTATVVGNDTAQDADTNPTDGLDVLGFGMLWDSNSARWDRAKSATVDPANANGLAASALMLYDNVNMWNRARSADASTQSAATKIGILAAAPPGNWSAVSFPATNVVAAAVQAAGAAGVRHICTGAAFGLSEPATALGFQGNLQILDGATIIWQMAISQGAGTAITPFPILVTGLALVGSAATPMTAQFSAAGGLATQESAVLMGYDVA